MVKAEAGKPNLRQAKPRPPTPTGLEGVTAPLWRKSNHPGPEVQMTSTKRKTAKATTTKTTSRAAAAIPANRKSRKRTRRASDNDKHNAGKAGVITTVDGRQTKQASILGLLQRPDGASIDDLTEATKWRAHSVRAALTGLRKRGHEVVRAKDDAGVTRYRIAGER